jgi:hypothetical protein
MAGFYIGLGPAIPKRHISGILRSGKYEGQRTTKVDMGGGGKKGLEGLESP